MSATADAADAAAWELVELEARLAVTHAHLDADARARKARRVQALLARSRDPRVWTSAAADRRPL